ncbi:MAG: family 10 glycosylhydrolase [Candidatus Hydrogenedens sp.]
MFLRLCFIEILLSFTPWASSEFWYEKARVGMEVGPTGAQWGFSSVNDERYCSKWDGAEIVRRCHQANCDYVVVWVRDGDYAYYNSKILLKAPGLKDRDPLKESINEAKKYNMPVIAYCVVQQGGHYIEQHPEFLMHDLNGKPIYHRFCYNSGYLEVMKQIVDEIMDYGVQGFHIDMVDQGFGPPYGCACPACKNLFKEQYGLEMPTSITWDDAWKNFLEFRYKSSENFEKKLYAYIKNRDAKVSVDFNYHGNPPFSFEVGQRPVQHGENGDFITGETGIWGFSALTVGLNAEFYRSAVPHQRVQVAIQRGVRMYHDQTTRPLNDIRWELLTLFAHGSFVTMVDKLGFDGTADPIAYNRIGKAFQEIKEKKGFFYHKPVYEVGIYFSSKTRDWVARENPSIYFTSFQGTHKAMVYEHIPWGILLDENCTYEKLIQFPVVILPNVGILSSAEINMFTNYVYEGGKLIITGVTGCYDDFGNIGTYKLEPLTGCKFVSKLESEDNWISLGPTQSQEEEQLAKEIEHAHINEEEYKNSDTMPLLIRGPAGIFETTSAKAIGKLWKPYRTQRQTEGKEGTDLPMSPETTIGPAIFINHIGKGTVMTWTCSPDYALGSEYALSECRKLMLNAVHYLNPGPEIQISAPSFVETVILRKPENDGFYVHCIAYSSPPQTIPMKNRPYILPSLIEDTPCFYLTITTVNPIQSTIANNTTTQIERIADNKIKAFVTDIHEVITLIH